MNRSDIRAAAAISILLALASGGLARVSLEWRVLGVEIVAVLALIYVWRRWAHLLPHGGVPWYRLILVTTLVIVSLFVAGQSFTDFMGFGRPMVPLDFRHVTSVRMG